MGIYSHARQWCMGLTLLILVMTIVALPPAHGQDLELNGGWDHVSGNFGTNGFVAGAAWWFTPRVTIAANYETTWNTSTLSTFTFTQIGPIAVKSHLQSALIGPRIFFPIKTASKHKLSVFGEAQFGGSHLNQTITQVGTSVSNSDSSFTWLLGGGADYLFSPHWSARGNLDFMRTHFANTGQSHLRLTIGVAYTFGRRAE
jgi:hypothetical protein